MAPAGFHAVPRSKPSCLSLTSHIPDCISSHTWHCNLSPQLTKCRRGSACSFTPRVSAGAINLPPLLPSTAKPLNVKHLCYFLSRENGVTVNAIDIKPFLLFTFEWFQGYFDIEPWTTQTMKWLFLVYHLSAALAGRTKPLVSPVWYKANMLPLLFHVY